MSSDTLDIESLVSRVAAADSVTMRPLASAARVPASFYQPGSGTRWLKTETLRQRVVDAVKASPETAQYVAHFFSGRDAASQASADPAPGPVPRFPGDPGYVAPPEPAEPFTPPGELVNPGPPAAARTPDVTSAVAALVQSLMAGNKPGIDADAVRAIVHAEVAKRVPREIVVRVNDAPPVNVDGATHVEFPRVLARAAARVHALLVGPAGSGKTHLAEQVAKALGLNFYHVSCSAGMSEGVLLGRLLPTGENGRFIYARSEFVQAYEDGGVFLMDEIDAADSNTLIVVNSALANGHMSVPNRLDRPRAIRHKDFVCMAAANTFGNGADRLYVGRNQLDAATLNRFTMGTVSMDYDPTLEETLIPGAILTWGRAVRDSIRAHNLRRILSTRDMLNAAKLESSGGKAGDWRQSYFDGWKQDELSKISTSLRVGVK